jgi:hypothetical protein
VFDHEVGSDLFFRTQDDSIFALNSEYGSNWGSKYYAVSTALAAYSSCSSRPSCV